MSDSVASSLFDGRLVQLDGLHDFAAYNGCIGRVFGRDFDGRYKVCVRAKGKSKKLLVQSGNIRVLSAQCLLHDVSLADEVRRLHYFAPGHLVKVLRGPHRGLNGRVARGSTSRLHDPHVLVHLDTKFRGPPIPCRQIDLRRVMRTEMLRSTDPTVQEIQRTWCRVLLQPAAGAASKPLRRVLKSLRLVDTLARERALMLLEQKKCQAEAWQQLQTKISRIDKTVIPSTGKLFSSVDLDNAKEDLEQLQHVQELADFFRDFVGLRRQIGGLIVSFAILERHPMFCRGERVVVTSGQWKDRNATVVEDCGWSLSWAKVDLNGDDAMPVCIPKHICVKLPRLFRTIL